MLFVIVYILLYIFTVFIIDSLIYTRYDRFAAIYQKSFLTRYVTLHCIVTHDLHFLEHISLSICKEKVIALAGIV